jgi:hypothetical protein
MPNVPFMKGEQCTATFFVGGTKREVLCKSWELSPNVTVITDDVNGESRSRLDKSLNFYDLKLEVFAADTKLLAMFIEEQAAHDAGGQPLDVSSGIGLKPRDGSKFALALTEGVIDAWSFKAPGRTDRATYSVPLRYRDAKTVPL